MWQSITEIQVAGNELWRILSFCMVVLLSLIIGRLSRLSMRRVAEKLSGRREWQAVILRALSGPVVLLAFSCGLWLCAKSSMLVLPGAAQSLFDTSVHILVAVAVGFALYSLTALADFALQRAAAGTETKVDDMLVPLVGKSIRITILVLVVAQIIQSVSDKPLTSVIAGLGVGGLAVALAGQDTVRNFFGSLVIVADKPFEIGDRIVVDGHDGPVESVGFRSTRIRTLDGHVVTVPNGEMVNKSVQNIGKRPYIRRIANITVTYDTSPPKMEEALDIIRDILKDHEGFHQDFPARVYFDDFNDSSLNILVIYWYHPPDYWAFLKFSEWVNMEILKRFNDAGIEFAFPTRTVHLAGSAGATSAGGVTDIRGQT